MLIESAEQYEEILEESLEKLNENPTMESLISFEHSLDFYSDIYKDDYGYRPSLAKYRGRYNEKTKVLFEEFWNSL